MNEYQFTLKIAIKDSAENIDELVERLGAEGCTDALVGIGQPGRIGLDFTREAKSALEALKSAFRDVKRAIPESELVEAAPDLVGLTDMATFLGFSRQNMRKLAGQGNSDFPPPVHEGVPSIWHLSTVLDWMNARGTHEIEGSLQEVAKANMQFNLVKELHHQKLEPGLQKDLQRLLGTGSLQT